jgi:hypothetical protein
MIKSSAQHRTLHSAHGLRCLRVGGPLSSLGRIRIGPGYHDHGGPTSPCRRDTWDGQRARDRRGHRRPAVGQGVEAPMGLAPTREGVLSRLHNHMSCCTMWIVKVSALLSGFSWGLSKHFYLFLPVQLSPDFVLPKHGFNEDMGPWLLA